MDSSIIALELSYIDQGYYEHGNRDLLSPPPFLRNSYSMGKLPAVKDRAILEFRGYSAKYPQMVMGKPAFIWLENEVDSVIFNLTSILDIKPGSLE